MENKLRQIFGDKLKKISDVADVVCGPFGSAIKNTDYRESGIPLVRITNISKDGYMNYDDLIFVSEELGNSLSRTQVSSGDIVVSQRGSLGQCAIVDEAFPKMNISANIIAIKNLCGVSATFLHDYFLSTVGQTLLERSVSGQVQQKITTQDIADLLIPTDTEEERLTSLINKAYESYKSKLQKADKLVEQSKSNVFKEIGIEFRDYHPSLFSQTTKKQISEVGIFCNPHSAYLNAMFEKLRSNSLCVGTIEKYVDVNPTINRSELAEHTQVSFVPMQNVSEKENHADYSLCEYSEVKTGFTAFQKDDLLWAKITPCMQNGKSFIASDMPTQCGFGSTEFHVLRAKSDDIYMPFLWVFLSEEHVLEVAQGMFCGSAGQQRVPDTFLKKLPLVLPDYKKQVELANIVMEALDKARLMRQEAEQEWSAAKAQFEKELLGG